MNIYDIVDASILSAVWEEQQSNRVAYLGEVLFPASKKVGLDLAWIRGKNQLPAQLRASWFDAEATVRDRIGLQKLANNMPFFREGMTINEMERQELLKVQEANMQYYTDFLAQIYNDRMTLLQGALVVSERMRMELLLSAKINIVDNAVEYTYDYDPDGEWTANNYLELTGTDVWTDYADSNPVITLRTMQDRVEDATGTRPARIMMTRKTFYDLMLNEKIKLDMNSMGGSNVIMTDTMMKQYISAKLGLEIITYDKSYSGPVGDDSGTHKFYPDNYVTLLPTGTVGRTWYGTTPEEADLRSGQTDATVEIVNTGIAITTYKQIHPVNVKTLVSEVVLPSFEGMDNVATIKVA